jgi:predicted RNase H-like HicB family nuclease
LYATREVCENELPDDATVLDTPTVRPHNGTTQEGVKIMQYPVLIEQKNGAYQATIPALADLRVEAATAVEALQKAQQAAEEYLAKITVATIELPPPQNQPMRRGSPQSALKAAGGFVGDEEAMLQHIEEIYAARRKEVDDLEQEEVAA